MGGIAQDLRFSFRTLRKNPGFTLAAALALAIGIGANTAIFSVVNAVLLRPLPYPESGRLARVWEKRPRLAKGRVSFADYNDWKAQNHVFEAIAAYQVGDYNLTGGDEPEQVHGAAVSADLFSVLRAEREAGRTFMAEEERQKSNPVLILSHGLWARRFGANPSLLGQTVNLDNKTYSVVGIMPEDFSFPARQTELWVPLAINPNSPIAGRGMHILEVVARLKPGVSLAQARAEMDTIAGRLERQYPEENTGHGVSVLSLQDDVTGNFRTGLLIIFSVVGFVLLIACTNVANLLLARAATRRKEIALRTALGATRVRIVRQLLTESLLLSVTGGALGLLIGYWCVELVVLLSAGNVPRIEESNVDLRVLLFTLLTSLVTGIVFGLAPALQISRTDLNETLKEGGAGGATNTSGKRLRGALVVAEVALSLVLLIGAGLTLKSFARVQSVAPGFSAENVLTAKINLPNSKYRGSQRAAFAEQVLERIRANPQVIAAGAVTHLPLAGNGPTFNFDVDGRPPARPGEEFKAQMRCATPDYFRALGVPVLEGRPFSSRDSADAPNVVIINDMMAQRYWPDESPVGKRISLDKDDAGRPVWREIIGVVRGVRHDGLEFEPEPQMYTPLSQFSMPFLTFAIHTKGQPLNLVGDLRREVLAADKNQPVSDVRTMEQIVSESIAPRQFNMLLLGLFAGIAVLLAAIGIYGVISYSVTQRTRELAIRVALGASPGDVMRLVVRQGLALTGVGLVIGTGLALVVGRLLQSQLLGASDADPLTFVGIPLLLTAVALLACYLPARRAAKVDPMIALRYE
ncbi:MAG: ABC transporter permease [Acidobacteriota bacterium]|nr:ABC transporter permease [Acidobacteriota bacterium]